MLFYAFKMALLFASLCVNASDQICSLNLHTAGSDTIFQIYLEAPLGVPGVSKIRISFLQLKVLSSCPFGSQNIKNKVFRFELFYLHLTLWQSVNLEFRLNDYNNMTDRETTLQAYEAAHNCVQPKNDKQENRLLLVFAKAYQHSACLGRKRRGSAIAELNQGRNKGATQTRSRPLRPSKLLCGTICYILNMKSLSTSGHTAQE